MTESERKQRAEAKRRESAAAKKDLLEVLAGLGGKAASYAGGWVAVYLPSQQAGKWRRSHYHGWVKAARAVRHRLQKEKDRLADAIAKMAPARREAIGSGVSNLYDTVYVDKAMTASEAASMLESFVSDGLQVNGFGDQPTALDMAFAKSCLYFQEDRD